MYSGGYSCTNIVEQTCKGIVSASSIKTVNCVSGTSDTPSYLTIPMTITAAPAQAAKVVATTMTVFTLWAPLIQLNFQASDLIKSTSKTGISSTSDTTSTATMASSLSSSLIPVAPTSQSQQQTNLPVSLSQHSTSLSTGAKVGIGVAVGVAALALVAAIALWLLYRQSRKRSGPKDSFGTFQLLGVSKRPYPSVSELPQPIAELPQPIAELPQPIPELAISKYHHVVHELGT